MRMFSSDAKRLLFKTDRRWNVKTDIVRADRRIAFNGVFQ